MLVITRSPGEAVWIETSDGPIKVEFVEHRHAGQVRLGFAAPEKVKIWRDSIPAPVPAGTPRVCPPCGHRWERHGTGGCRGSRGDACGCALVPDWDVSAGAPSPA